MVENIRYNAIQKNELTALKLNYDETNANSIFHISKKSYLINLDKKEWLLHKKRFTLSEKSKPFDSAFEHPIYINSDNTKEVFDLMSGFEANVNDFKSYKTLFHIEAELLKRRHTEMILMMWGNVES